LYSVLMSKVINLERDSFVRLEPHPFELIARYQYTVLHAPKAEILDDQKTNRASSTVHCTVPGTIVQLYQVCIIERICNGFLGVAN
jgi:hypothetical protein